MYGRCPSFDLGAAALEQSVRHELVIDSQDHRVCTCTAVVSSARHNGECHGIFVRRWTVRRLLTPVECLDEKNGFFSMSVGVYTRAWSDFNNICLDAHCLLQPWGAAFRMVTGLPSYTIVRLRGQSSIRIRRVFFFFLFPPLEICTVVDAFSVHDHLLVSTFEHIGDFGNIHKAART